MRRDVMKPLDGPSMFGRRRLSRHRCRHGRSPPCVEESRRPGCSGTREHGFALLRDMHIGDFLRFRRCAWDIHVPNRENPGASCKHPERRANIDTAWMQCSRVLRGNACCVRRTQRIAGDGVWPKWFYRERRRASRLEGGRRSLPPAPAPGVACSTPRPGDPAPHARRLVRTRQGGNASVHLPPDRIRLQRPGAPGEVRSASRCLGGRNRPFGS